MDLIFESTVQGFNPSDTSERNLLSDLDGDGDLDVLEMNFWEDNAVWLNDGTGYFTRISQTLGQYKTSGIDLGDIDGDGDLDFVVGTDTNISTIISLGDGTGFFTNSPHVPGSNNTYALQLGDLDGDGDLDLYEGNRGFPDWVFFNDGSGIFSDSGQRIGGGTNETNDVRLEDLDGDGDLDAFLANHEQPNRVYFNDGSGFFTNSGQALGNAGTLRVKLGDLDGDGDLDAFCGNSSGYQHNTAYPGAADRVWLNDGDGYFTDSGQALGLDRTTGVALGDLDGDGDLDAVTVAWQHPGRVWLNDGNAVFTELPADLTTSSDSAAGVSLGDLDGDGWLDVFATIWGRNKVFLSAECDGGLNTNTYIISTTADVNGSISPEGPVAIAHGSSTSFVVDAGSCYIVDVLLDGVSQGVFGPGFSVYTLEVNNVSGAIALEAEFNCSPNLGFTATPTTGSTPLSVTYDFSSSTDADGDIELSEIDLHGDGIFEISEPGFGSIIVSYTGEGSYTSRLRVVDAEGEISEGLSIIEVSGVSPEVCTGLYFTLTAQNFSPSDTGERNILSDMDGDGDLDVFEMNFWEDNAVWLNNGTGFFTKMTQELYNYKTSAVDLGDIDGDSDMDLVAGTDTNIDTVISLGNGTGYFTKSPHVPGSNNTCALQLGDLDGDGDLDIYEGNRGFPDWVFFNNGFGIFSDSGQRIAGTNETNDVRLEDLDGDGDLDVFLANNEQPNNVYFNDGHGVFTDSGQQLGTSGTWRVKLGDLDGDGDLDAFCGNQSGYEHNTAFPGSPDRVWLNDGSGYFTNSGQSLGLDRTTGVALGDLDNDGDLDAVTVAWQHPGRVWLNNGNAIFTELPVTLTGSGDSAAGVSVGDLDNDGWLDIFATVWGVNKVFLSSGCSDGPITNTYTITTSADINGTIQPAGPVTMSHEDSTSFVVDAGSCYIVDVRMDGISQGTFGPGVSSHTQYFGRVVKDHLLEAEFNCFPVLGVVADPTTGAAPLRVAYDFSTSTDLDGDIERSEVDLHGDGIYEISVIGFGSVAVDYPAVGTYTSFVRVVDADGASAQGPSIIDVTGSAFLQAAIQANPASGEAPVLIALTATNSQVDPGYLISVYEWDLNGDGSFDEVTTNPVLTHVYSQAGTYDVVVRVTDNRGLQDEASTSVEVTPALNAPTVELSVLPDHGSRPLPATLIASGEDDGSIVEHHWDFDGDGQIDEVTVWSSVSHSYEDVGTFYPSVSVIDDQGLSASATSIVTVTAPSKLKVWISQPKDGATVSGSAVTLHANTAPGSLTASVVLQYRVVGSTGAWSNVDSVLYPPAQSYKVSWDTTGLVEAAYMIRAVAEDTGSLAVTSELVSVTVNTDSLSTAGGTEESSVEGKHTRRQVVSTERRASVSVYDGTTVDVAAKTFSSNVVVEVELTGSNDHELTGSVQDLDVIPANRTLSVSGTPSKPVKVRIPYPDADQDGFVDGTPVYESTLEAHFYDSDAATWSRALSFAVHTDENFVELQVYKPREIGLFGRTDLDGDGMDDKWELDHLGNTDRDGTEDFDGDGLADSLEFEANGDPDDPDSDDDGMTDLEEFLAGTALSDDASKFKMSRSHPSPADNELVLYWQSITGRMYKVYRAIQVEGAWSNIYQAQGDGSEMGYTNQGELIGAEFLRLEVIPLP